MKTKSTIPAGPSARPGHATRFEMTARGAKEVFIAGSFNDWHTADLPMIPLDEGKWGKALVLSPGRYEYQFIVDGTWRPDPAAREIVPNPYGGMNGVVVVPRQAK